jgi:hypothetical protein
MCLAIAKNALLLMYPQQQLSHHRCNSTAIYCLIPYETDNYFTSLPIPDFEGLVIEIRNHIVPLYIVKYRQTTTHGFKQLYF